MYNSGRDGMLKKIITNCVIFSFLISTSVIRAESVDDKYTQIVPSHTPGAGEYTHGQGYGKILVRVLMFGAVPTQGVHYVPEGTDLLFGILYCGGYADATKLNGIQIRRRAQKDLIMVNLEALIADGDKIPKLMDGDIVTVPFNWRKDITTIGLVTGFIAAMTGFTLSLIALSK